MYSGRGENTDNIFRFSNAQVICACEDCGGFDWVCEEGIEWAADRDRLTWTCGYNSVAIQQGSITIWFGVSNVLYGLGNLKKWVRSEKIEELF